MGDYIWYRYTCAGGEEGRTFFQYLAQTDKDGQPYSSVLASLGLSGCGLFAETPLPSNSGPLVGTANTGATITQGTGESAYITPELFKAMNEGAHLSSTTAADGSLTFELTGVTVTPTLSKALETYKRNLLNQTPYVSPGTLTDRVAPSLGSLTPSLLAAVLSYQQAKVAPPKCPLGSYSVAGGTLCCPTNTRFDPATKKCIPAPGADTDRAAALAALREKLKAALAAGDQAEAERIRKEMDALTKAVPGIDQNTLLLIGAIGLLAAGAVVYFWSRPRRRA